MLSYLVSSPSRRLLLEALWQYGMRGSVSALAKKAFVSFASAYRELHAMLAHDLVTTSQEDGVTVFGANEAHPLAASMRALVSYRRNPKPSPDTAGLRAQLASLGAPIGTNEKEAPPVDDLEAVVVAGTELARHEPSTARAFPLLLFRQAEHLDFERLGVLARKRHVRHALGFLLALTGKLARDPHLTRAAHRLRDRRVRRQPFFYAPPRREPYPPTGFPLAYRWGFRLNMDEATFASTFERFTRVRS